VLFWGENWERITAANTIQQPISSWVAMVSFNSSQPQISATTDSRLISSAAGVGCSSLTHDLQGIGNTHTQNARIGQREPAVEDIMHIRCLCQEHGNGREQGTDEALDGIEPNSI